MKKLIKPVLSAALQIFVLFAGLTWLLSSGANSMGYQWQWERVPDFIAFYEEGQWWPAELIDGLTVTIKISMISLLFTLLIGMVTALLRLSSSRVGRGIALLYVELIEILPYWYKYTYSILFLAQSLNSTVLLQQLWRWLYSKVLIRPKFLEQALTVFQKGQYEAAKSLGLNRFFTFYDVILPKSFNVHYLLWRMRLFLW